MEEKCLKGFITVFLSLVSVVFFSLICTAVEAVRVQGARAQAANITDMGNYSVFGEYEKKLLEDYEIFAVDGSLGTGDFSIDRINDRMKSYLICNANPKQEKLSGLCFDPWQLGLDSGKITEYALLTDQNGAAFYQQAVSYMKATAVTGAVGKLLQYNQDAQTAKNGQEMYEKEKYSSDREMKELEQQEAEKKKELEEQRKQQEGQMEQGNVLIPPAENSPEERKTENPLKMMNKLRKKKILAIVCGSASLSSKKVGSRELASKRSGKKGKMKLEQPHGGLVSNLLFREYLLDRFPNYLSRESGGKLDYQIEYILCGKKSDQDNLKGVVQRLLLLREGMNYLYCVGDGEMNAQAGSLAALLIGWTGIPALTAVLKHGLLLGWAYGESLLDVKTLMDGGKIPLSKTPETWMVSLDHLGELAKLLEKDGSGRQEGVSYREYLRMLLNLQFVSIQKKRGLDMLELNLKSAPGLSDFQVNNCIVGMKSTTEWTIAPVFMRVPAVFLKTGTQSWNVTVNSGFAYDY